MCVTKFWEFGKVFPGGKPFLKRTNNPSWNKDQEKMFMSLTCETKPKDIKEWNDDLLVLSSDQTKKEKAIEGSKSALGAAENKSAPSRAREVGIFWDGQNIDLPKYWCRRAMDMFRGTKHKLDENKTPSRFYYTDTIGEVATLVQKEKRLAQQQKTAPTKANDWEQKYKEAMRLKKIREDAEKTVRHKHHDLYKQGFRIIEVSCNFLKEAVDIAIIVDAMMFTWFTLLKEREPVVELASNDKDFSHLLAVLDALGAVVVQVHTTKIVDPIAQKHSHVDVLLNKGKGKNVVIKEGRARVRLPKKGKVVIKEGQAREHGQSSKATNAADNSDAVASGGVIPEARDVHPAASGVVPPEPFKESDVDTDAVSDESDEMDKKAREEADFSQLIHMCTVAREECNGESSHLLCDGGTDEYMAYKPLQSSNPFVQTMAEKFDAYDDELQVKGIHTFLRQHWKKDKHL